MERLMRKIILIAITGTIVSLATGCAKHETNTPAVPATALNVEKSASQLFQMINGTGACQFGVQTGCNGCAGIIANNTIPGLCQMRRAGQTATVYTVEGFTDPACTNTMYFNMTKGPNSTTGGPIYYIVPNQGPAVGKEILKIQVKGVTVPAWSSPVLIYDVSRNDWTVDPVTAGSFITSIVTTTPASTCCFPC
jgi:hypothetical protein